MRLHEIIPLAKTHSQTKNRVTECITTDFSYQVTGIDSYIDELTQDRVVLIECRMAVGIDLID